MIALALFGFDTDPEYQLYFIASVIGWTFGAGTVAFVPALIAIVLAEAFSWRSVLYYLAVGGLIGLSADQLWDGSRNIDFADQTTIVFLAAGFVGGFVYWLIAGRLAGIEPVTPDASPGR